MCVLNKSDGRQEKKVIEGGSMDNKDTSAYIFVAIVVQISVISMCVCVLTAESWKKMEVSIVKSLLESQTFSSQFPQI